MNPILKLEIKELKGIDPLLKGKGTYFLLMGALNCARTKAISDLVSKLKFKDRSFFYYIRLFKKADRVSDVHRNKSEELRDKINEVRNDDHFSPMMMIIKDGNIRTLQPWERQVFVTEIKKYYEVKE